MGFLGRYNLSRKNIVIGVFIGCIALVPVLVLGRLRFYDEGSLILLGCYFLALTMFISGFSQYKQFTLIRDTPTSTLRSMPMGAVEVKGTAKAIDRTLTSPFSGEECLFYTYKIERYDTSDDNNHWETIDSGFEGVRFGLDDDTGAIVVDSTGAILDMPEDNRITARGDNVNDYVKDFVTSKSNVGTGEGAWIFDERRRYTETFLTPGEDIYVFGYATKESEDGETEYPIITKSSKAPLFMISDKSEKELRKSQRNEYLIMLGLGGIGSLVTYAIILMTSGLL